MIVNGNKSVLIPPVTAASYQRSRRLNSSVNRLMNVSPSIKFNDCHSVITMPSMIPVTCWRGHGSRDCESSNPVDVANKTIKNNPGVSTQSASCTDHAVVPTAAVSKINESHPCRGPIRVRMVEYLDFKMSIDTNLRDTCDDAARAFMLSSLCVPGFGGTGYSDLRFGGLGLTRCRHLF